MDMKDRIELRIYRGRNGDAQKEAQNILEMFEAWLSGQEEHMYSLIVDTENIDQREAAETIIGAMKHRLTGEQQ